MPTLQSGASGTRSVAFVASTREDKYEEQMKVAFEKLANMHPADLVDPDEQGRLSSFRHRPGKRGTRLSQPC